MRVLVLTEDVMEKRKRESTMIRETRRSATPSRIVEKFAAVQVEPGERLANPRCWVHNHATRYTSYS